MDIFAYSIFNPPDKLSEVRREKDEFLKLKEEEKKLKYMFYIPSKDGYIDEITLQTIIFKRKLVFALEEYFYD